MVTMKLPDIVDRAMRSKAAQGIQVHKQASLYKRVRVATIGWPVSDLKRLTELGREFCVSLTRDNSLGPGRVNVIVAHLRAVGAEAVANGDLAYNPWSTDRMRFPRLSVKPRRRGLTNDELSRLFKSASEKYPWLEMPMKWCSISGIPTGDLRNLRIRDVNLFSSTAMYSRVKTGVDACAVITDQLKDWFVSRVRKSESDDEYVFLKDRAQLPEAHSLDKYVKKIAKHAQVNDFRFYDLRHAAATRMIDSGATLSEVCSVMGWTDYTMPAHYYEFNRSKDAASLLKKLKYG
jgi:integrase